MWTEYVVKNRQPDYYLYWMACGYTWYAHYNSRLIRLQQNSVWWLLSITQCMYIKSDNRLRSSSLRCCVLSSLRSIRLQQNMNCLNMHYVDRVCSKEPTTRLLPLLDGLWLYFICSLQLPTNPTPSELCMVCDAYIIQSRLIRLQQNSVWWVLRITLKLYMYCVGSTCL